MPDSISDAALAVLRDGDCDGNRFVIQSGQLAPKLYKEVNTVLERLGGRWDRRQSAHLFDRPVAPMIEAVVASGEFMASRSALGDFETPPALAARLMDYGQIAALPPNSIVLEPSAGRGNLARAIAACNPGVTIWCVEKDPTSAAILRAEFAHVWEQDFTKWTPPNGQMVDAVVANPPYKGYAYASHLRHATRFLREDGVGVAIVPLTPEEQGIAVREMTAAAEWLEQQIATSEFLGSSWFADQGATVDVKMIRWQRERTTEPKVTPLPPAKEVAPPMTQRTIEHLDVLLICCSSECTRVVDEAVRQGQAYGPYPLGPREVDVLTYTATSGTCVNCGASLGKGEREKLVARINRRLAKAREEAVATRVGAELKKELARG